MSIQYAMLGLNPRPSGHESPPITTRPGLPPNVMSKFSSVLSRSYQIGDVGKIFNLGTQQPFSEEITKHPFDLLA